MGKKNRVYNFVVEVCVESPGDVEVEEAEEDAAEFMSTLSRSKGRVHESFVSITNVRELGPLSPDIEIKRGRQKVYEGGINAVPPNRIKKAKPKKKVVKRV